MYAACFILTMLPLSLFCVWESYGKYPRPKWTARGWPTVQRCLHAVKKLGALHIAIAQSSGFVLASYLGW